MSTIGISISGLGLNDSINVQRMNARLNAASERLGEEIGTDGSTHPVLGQRLETLNGQIERLHTYDGQSVEVSAEYAMDQLASGMRYLQEGIHFSEKNGRTNEAGKLQEWYDHLDNTYRQIDARA